MVVLDVQEGTNVGPRTGQKKTGVLNGRPIVRSTYGGYSIRKQNEPINFRVNEFLAMNYMQSRVMF